MKLIKKGIIDPPFNLKKEGLALKQALMQQPLVK